MELASIRVFPVKSLGGVQADEALVEPWGLRGDRRWLVLTPDGTALTAREEHRMLGLTATPDGEAIVLTDRDGGSLRVEPPADGESLPTTLSRVGTVRAADPAAGRWLSERLGTEVRLGWLDDPRRRSVAENHGGRPGDVLSLADAGPLLLASTASLRRLDDWIAEGAVERGEEPPASLPMERFRPTVVVDGAETPFAEDEWRGVTIGEVSFRFTERCDRCVLTTVDTQTLAAGKEPLRTLAVHRQWDHKTWFGIRLVPETTGVIRVGDPVSSR
jgi:uncharacterized protein YcbX